MNIKCSLPWCRWPSLILSRKMVERFLFLCPPPGDRWWDVVSWDLRLQGVSEAESNAWSTMATCAWQQSLAEWKTWAVYTYINSSWQYTNASTAMHSAKSPPPYPPHTHHTQNNEQNQTKQTPPLALPDPPSKGINYTHKTGTTMHKIIQQF